MPYLNIFSRYRRVISQQLHWLGLTFLVLVLTGFTGFFIPSNALNVSDIPNPRASGGWVSDTANLLSNPTEAQLNQWIVQLEAQNGTEIAIVTVSKTQPAASPKEFTTELFNTWKIGKAGEDNGILFLISVGDRRVEIETGYGIEGILPDGKIGRIIDEKIIPQFKQGNFEGGIVAGTRQLVNIASGGNLPTASPVSSIPSAAGTSSTNSFDSQLFLLTALISGSLALFIIRLVQKLGKRKVFIPPIDYKHFGELDECDRRDYNIFCWGVFFGVFAFYLSILMIVSTFIPQLFFLIAYGIIGSSLLILILINSPSNVLGTIFLAFMLFSFFTQDKLWKELIFLAFCQPFTVILTTGIPSIFYTLSIRLWLWKRFMLSKNSEGERKRYPFHCATCTRKMTRVPTLDILSLLTDIERTTRQLISINYEGWRCHACHPKLSRDGINFRAYTLHIPDNIKKCPTCQDYTVERDSKIIRKATYSHSGKRLIEQVCHCCDYHKQWTEIIAKKTESSSSSSEGSSSSSSSSGSCSSGSSSSSSGGSYGGGSSGGGGAGGDW